MPGFGPNKIVLTPERKLRVIFDSISPQLIESGTVFHKEADEVAALLRERSAQDEAEPDSLVTYRPGAGFTLLYDVEAVRYQQRIAQRSGFLSADEGNAVLGQYVVQEDTARQPDDIPWYQSVALLLAGSTPMLQQVMPSNVTDGSTIRIPSDGHIAKPQPMSISLDEVLRSDGNHDPRSPHVIQFVIPGPGSDAQESLLNYYFNGPVGVRDDKEVFTGTGQYVLEVHADGTAQLFERDSVASAFWRPVFTFRYTPVGKVEGAHQIVIMTDCYQEISGEMRGRVLAFGNYSVSSNQSLSDAVGGEQFGIMPLTWAIYKANTSDTLTLPDIQQDRIRIMVRRDLRMRFGARTGRTVATQANPGRLVLGPFITSRPYTRDNQVTVYLYGDEPTGTTLPLNVHVGSSTGPTLTELNTGLLTGNRGRWYVFDLPKETQGSLWPVLTLSPDSNGEHTPIYRAHAVYIPPITETPTLVSETIATNVVELELTLGTDDPSVERCRVVIKDVEDKLSSILRVRGGMPVRIEMAYTDSNPDLYIPIFHGYLREAVGRRISPEVGDGIGADRKEDLQAYPSKDYWQYDCQIEGEYMRLAELVTTNVLDVGKDSVSGVDADRERPMKITEIIRWFFFEGGYEASMLDIPDLDTRFFKTEGRFLIEGFEGIVEKVRDLSKNWLGMYIQWDASAGTFGKWRLRFYPKTSGPDEYNILAEFYDKLPGGWRTGAPILAHDEAAYPDVTESHDLGGDPFDQEVVGTFVRQGTLHSNVFPPEANIIMVFGATAQATNLAVVTTIQKSIKPSYNFNPKSFQLFPGQPIAADPTSPDYLGRAKVSIVLSPHLISQEAVDWVGRRIYDRAAHGIIQYKVTIPAILIRDSNDAENGHPRFLRYGDAIRYNGVKYIVRDSTVRCESRHGGTDFMWNDLTVETPPPTALLRT